jgi:site-specific DNA-methyltransferase (adenine-specific)
MNGCGRKIGKLDCCTIVRGDCSKYLDEIPNGSIDLIVSDPPYGMRYRSWKRKKHGPIHGDVRYPAHIINRLIEIPRLASYFFCRWDNLWQHDSRLPKPKSVLVWQKRAGNGTGDCKHEHKRAYEMILFYPRVPRGHQFLYRPDDIIRGQRTGNDLHPTQKPTELILEMLSWYDFETVLDPFAGSGSTARAARLLGKHFLAFEIAKTHYETAVAFVQRALPNKPVRRSRDITPALDFGDKESWTPF